MKKLLTIVIALLMSITIMGTALAEYGYTDVSRIPQAADFTFRVEFDDNGEAHVITDYPYQTTGATEMALVYHKDEYEDVTLYYQFAADCTLVGHGYFEDHHTIPDGKETEEIRNGTVTLDDTIWIYTTNNNAKTDWLLSYSISKKAYTQYEEKTFSQGYDGMGAGGERKLISFTDGRLDQSYYQKRTGDGDFCIVYNKDGEIVYAYAYLYKGTNKGSYNYDESTGLFSGKKLSELGYNDSDINVPAPAAVGDRKDPNRITAYIIRCYRNILGREPEADELNTWNGELSSGRQTAAGIADQFAGSNEFKRRHLPFADMVENLYLTMLDRSADPAEKTEWVRRLQNGQRLKVVLNGITTSQEYISLCETNGIQPGVVKVPVIR